MSIWHSFDCCFRCADVYKLFPYLDHLSFTLTHWGRVTHICISKLTIIGSDNGLAPGRRQAIIWTSAEIMLIGPLGANFSEIMIEIFTFSFKKMRLKMSSGKWRPSCLGLNVLNQAFYDKDFIFSDKLLQECASLRTCLGIMGFPSLITYIWGERLVDSYIRQLRVEYNY